MERHELYEPEDIEHLLIERAYDDLLEEERAFVLRHLSGRDEYEAMRALLLRVHDDDEPAEVMDADPVVRANVMDVFRTQQQPQWRIWLNSVHAFLLPKEASAMWRPALALGTVALVVMIAVVGTRTLEKTSPDQVAQVKEPIAPPPPREEAPVPAQQPVETTTRTDGPTSGDADLKKSTEELEAPVVVHDMNGQLEERQEFDRTATVDEPAPASANEAATEDVATVTLDLEDKAMPYKDIIALPSADSTVSAAGAFITQHEVTAKELTYNMTTAGATVQSIESISTQSARKFEEGERSKKAKAEHKAEGFFKLDQMDGSATADVSAFVDLLRAAW